LNIAQQINTQHHMKTSEIILLIIFTLLVIIDIDTTINKKSKNYIHIIDTNINHPFNIEDCINKYRIEADTVDNQIFYRLYWKEKL
jgi:hypothetical protein